MSLLQKGGVGLGGIYIGQAAVGKGGVLQTDATGAQGGEEGVHPAVARFQPGLESGEDGFAVDAAGGVLPAVPGDGNHRLPFRSQRSGQEMGQLSGEEGDVTGNHKKGLRTAEAEQGKKPPQRAPSGQKIGDRGKAGQVIALGADGQEPLGKVGELGGDMSLEGLGAKGK